MSMILANRRAIVAGGSRGIGRAIALAFAEAGAAISICARGADGLANAAAEFSRGGGTVHSAVCDLSSEEEINRYISEAAAALGGIDILVNNASGFGARDDELSWSTSMTVDVMAAVRASRAALPYLQTSDSGAIINISSISGLRASTRTPAYGAAKAAIIHYTASQAAMLARHKIRVNCIAPGSIEFPGGVWDRRRQEEPALYERTLKGIPFQRMGRPEEIAAVATFLASPMASWMTGQIIAVDGGQSL